MAEKTRAKRKKRVAVFIDGSNFYFKVKSLVPRKMDLLHYRYRDLVKDLLDKDESLSYIGYYIGVVRDNGKYKNSDKAHELRKQQQRLFDQLGHQKITVVRGYLLEREGKFFEKGVDVRLAIDIVGMAFDKQYDTAYVISSDTDMIPAIRKAQKYKKDIVHVGFEHQPSLALIRQSNRSRIVTRKGIERFTGKPFEIRRYDD